MIQISEKFKLSIRDYGQAFLNIVIGSVLTAVSTSIAAKHFPTVEELKVALLVGLTAGVSHIVRKFMADAPKELMIDVDKTVVIDSKTKEVIAPDGKETLKID